MSNLWIKNIVRFVLLVLIQILLLNNINLGGYINPFVYIIFILFLPVNFGRGSVLFLAFLMGLTIDFFENSLGLHAAATVLMAFVRPFVLNLFFNNLEFTGNDEPGLARIGFSGVLRYVFLMVLIHNSALFILETFSADKLLFTFYRILLSTLVSTYVILIILLVFSRRKS